MEEKKPVAQATNRLVLTAVVLGRDCIRYSPAGVPLVDCVLSHTSQVVESGLARNVSVRVGAVAVGTMAEEITQLPLGQKAVFEGFVASRYSRRSTETAVCADKLVFHIQSFNIIP